MRALNPVSARMKGEWEFEARLFESVLSLGVSDPSMCFGWYIDSMVPLGNWTNSSILYVPKRSRATWTDHIDLKPFVYHYYKMIVLISPPVPVNRGGILFCSGSKIQIPCICRRLDDTQCRSVSIRSISHPIPSIEAFFHTMRLGIQLKANKTTAPQSTSLRRIQLFQGRATHSISTATPFGSSFTATQLLAGFESRKCNSYSRFTSAKSPMSVKKTVIFTTLLKSLPASFRISCMFLMQRDVL